MISEIVRCDICQGQSSPEVMKAGGWFCVPDKNIHVCSECYEKAKKFCVFCTKNGIKIPYEQDELASIDALLVNEKI